MNLTAAEHRTVLILMCLVKSATTDSTIKRLLGTVSFNSIYIHILSLKNMEGSQRSWFKDNFQVNIASLSEINIPHQPFHVLVLDMD